MPFLFKRKSFKKPDVQNVLHDKIAAEIFNVTIRCQEKCAAFLQRKTNRLSRAVKILLLISFCLLSTGYYIYHLKYGLGTYNGSSLAFEQIANDGNTYKPADVILNSNRRVEEYNRIKQFLIYMDSLNVTASGRHIRDSILKGRPGLMDSIRYIGKIYQSQSIIK